MFNSTTDNLIYGISEQLRDGGSGDFPSWNGRLFYGAGTTFNSTGLEILKTNSASKYAYIEEAVHIYTPGVDYTTATNYVSITDLTLGAMGGVFQDISSSYLAVTGGGTSYILIKKIELNILYPSTVGKYTPVYKIYVSLWYS